MDMPARVKQLISKIREADAMLIATPEPYGDNPFNEKPVAIINAFIGMLGGARAQYHLRQMFVFLKCIKLMS